MTTVTSQTIYRCCNDERVSAVRARAGLNGIEAIELVVPPGPLTSLPVELLVSFVKPIAVVPPPDALRVVGGQRGTALTVQSSAPTHDPAVIRIRLASSGDLATYELRLVDPGSPDQPLPGMDPVLAVAPFSFGVVCESTSDCGTIEPCPSPSYVEPLIDRLAKDFQSFRHVMLDRLSVLQPDWRDRDPADVRMALIELLAYVGDHLSYEQDAVATEAYLGTSRQRISVRRHARLVDYRMHDGLSARAWLQLEIGAVADVVSGPAAVSHGTFMTSPVERGLVLDLTTQPGRDERAELLRRGDVVFHVVGDDDDPSLGCMPQVFSQQHNRMLFHTWSGERCCLPPGSVRATLQGHLPSLAVGDVVILQEERDPRDGSIDNADSSLRHPVRLTHVDAGTAASHLADPATGDEITEVAWDDQDALPFTLTVSTEVSDGANGTVVHHDAAVVLGNIVLVEHGELQEPETLDIPTGRRPWRPRLDVPGVSQVLPPPGPDRSAAAIRRGSPESALAMVRLENADGVWLTGADLLGAGNGRRMVVEVDNDSFAWLRFGAAEADGQFLHGRPPRASQIEAASATVTYRVGVGSSGNVAAGAIDRTVITGDADTTLGASLLAGGVIVGISNPLPAWGGAEPESIERVRQRAPFAFQVTAQERAVTAEDYAARAMRFTDDAGPDAAGGVQRAVARLRWTGSWYTVFVAVDRFNGLPVDAGFETRLRDYLDRYRMAGHDVEIEPATDVPLEIRLLARIAPEAFRGRVMDELSSRLSNRRLADGSLGLFHPDRFTFAQTVYLSPVVAAAQAVAGVVDVRVTRFGPYRLPSVEARDSGYITVGRREIARLDNDPSRPQHGVLAINLEGGR